MSSLPQIRAQVAIERLAREQTAVALLRQHHTYEEIAKAMKTTRGAVAGLINRARAAGRCDIERRNTGGWK